MQYVIHFWTTKTKNQISNHALHVYNSWSESLTCFDFKLYMLLHILIQAVAYKHRVVLMCGYIKC
jgi:hypothetical protein